MITYDLLILVFFYIPGGSESIRVGPIRTRGTS